MRPTLRSGLIASVALGGCLALPFNPAAAIMTVPGPILISRAWAPAPAKEGGDTPLYMTIANNGDVPDNLIRAKCPFAQFTEKVTVDSGGEGSPSTREVKAIPIPARKAVVLKPGAWHIVLLQTTQPLHAGQILGCTITFQKAGQRLVEVAIAPPGAQSAP